MSPPDTAGPGPGYASRPGHTVRIEPHAGTVTVRFGGQEIARTSRALMLFEAGYPPVPYLPLDDVDGTVLERTERSTHCPFKGDAVYWTVSAGGKEAADAVWSYPRPFDEVPELAGHVAFYTGKMDSVEVS